MCVLVLVYMRSEIHQHCEMVPSCWQRVSVFSLVMFFYRFITSLFSFLQQRWSRVISVIQIRRSRADYGTRSRVGCGVLQHGPTERHGQIPVAFSYGMKDSKSNANLRVSCFIKYLHWSYYCLPICLDNATFLRLNNMYVLGWPLDYDSFQNWFILFLYFNCNADAFLFYRWNNRLPLGWLTTAWCLATSAAIPFTAHTTHWSLATLPLIPLDIASIWRMVLRRIIPLRSTLPPKLPSLDRWQIPVHVYMRYCFQTTQTHLYIYARYLTLFD